MKKIPILIAFFLIIPSAKAQTKDSLIFMIRQYDYYGALQKINGMNSDSLDSEILHLKATALKSLSRYPEAIACFEKIYGTDSANIELMLEMADCYKEIHVYRRPMELYYNALKLQPGNKFLMQMLANTYSAIDQFADAKRVYLTACKNDTSAFLLSQIGICYDKLGLEDSAILYYQKAIRWNPYDYQPVFKLATMYKSMREFKSGIAIVDSFLVRMPGNRDVTRLSAYLYYLDKNLPKAIDRFQQCIALFDTSEFVFKYLGYSYFKQDDYPNAIRCLEKVYAVDSTDAEMCYALGLAHDLPENIKYFNASIRLTSPAVIMLSRVYQDLALALTKVWNYTGALEALMKASQLTPDDPAIIYKIAVHYDNWMDDKATAVKYYRDFLATHSGNTGIPYVVTATYVVTQSDYDHAQTRIHDITLPEENPATITSDSTLNGTMP